MLDRSEELPDGTYIVAVKSLYETLSPSIIMAVAFIGVAARVASQTPDALLILFALAGGVTLIGRLGILMLSAIDAQSETLDLAGARRLERRFAIPYLAFAAAFGLFSARAFEVAPAESHMLVIGLLFGYGAGVSAGVFLRPAIALVSIALAVAPTAAVALTIGRPSYVAVGMLLVMFLTGGMQSMMRNYKTATAEITARRTFATLARADVLTGLANRLSLREAYDHATARVGRGIIAVHCLDLDRFKTVNDTFGHPVGDALLQAVATRLDRLLRKDDVAARTGGDEFVLLQVGVQHDGEAEMFARRIARAVAEPYLVHGHHLSIGTSVGYALRPEHGRDLEQLIVHADEALIDVKRAGGGVARYSPTAFKAPQGLCA